MIKKIVFAFWCFCWFWLLIITDSCMRSPNTYQVYTIARDPSWFPINLMGRDVQLTAFTDDLLAAIADEEGISIRFGPVLSEDLFEGLDEGDYDAVLTFKVPSLSNRDDFAFSEGFFFVGPLLLVSIHSHVLSLQEMNGAVIGITQEVSPILDVERYPDVTFLPFDSSASELEALTMQRIDGAILPAIPAFAYANGLYRDKVRVIPTPMSKDFLRAAAQRTPNGEAFIEHFDHGLKILITNGIYDALLEKWGFYRCCGES